MKGVYNNMIKTWAKNFINVGRSNYQVRDNWVKSVLENLPAGLTLLDAGAGEMKYKPYCKHLKYVSQDFCQYDGKGNNQGLQIGKWDYKNTDIVCDITNIPMPDRSFDAILCTEVFEHISDPILALKEFSRLLKKDGILILSAPFCSMTHMAPYHYYSGFNKYFYEKYLKEFSFDIIEISTNGNYFEYLAQELLRVPSIAENILRLR